MIMRNDESITEHVRWSVASGVEGRSLSSLSSAELGRYGEQVAADYLEQKGYEIIDRNVKVKKGEIDIWAKQEDTLVFVEVKTRRSAWSGKAIEAVDARKKEQLLRVIACSIVFMSIDMDMRFDVIAVQVVDDTQVALTHVQNVELA